MTNTGSTGNGPDPGDSSWTDETLPMSVRKELLDRELQKYSAGRRAHGAASQGRSSGHDGGSGHPSAGSETDEGGHAD